METKNESEFGKGLVICLVKFAEHKERFLQTTDAYKKSYMKKPESRAVEIFFNGASDHLYEIEVPEQWRGTEIAEKVTQLRDLGLEIGHGFTGTKYTEEQFNIAYNLLEEIALLIDTKLGLQAERGAW